MSKEKNVPKLRFPEFTDAWEQRKLLDCIQKITDFRGRTPKKLGMDWSEEGYLALSALNVKDGYIDFNQDVHYGNQELYDKWMTGNELHKGQVLFTTEAPMGNVAQVPDNRRYILSQRTIAFDVKDHLITENFLATVLRTPTVFADLTALSSGGTAKGVSQKSLASVEIRLPKDLKEQEKIADTFTNLDNLITLHQRKCEVLKEYKSGMLQKMFPREGQRVPEIRFPGFSDTWEQRKCEGILKPTKGAMKIGPFGSALKKEFYTETGVKVYAQENIFQEDFTIGEYYISEERYQTLKGCKLEPGDLVISMMGTIGACAIFPNNAKTGIMNSHLLRLQLNDDIYPEYIHQLLRDSQIIKSQIDRLSVGSIMSGLSSSVVQKLIFPVPSIDEQKKIAGFLMQLDNLITLHQRKCEELKKYKKGLLQQMFV